MFAGDVAACVDALLQQPAPPGGHRMLEVAGPETMTNREAVAAVLAPARPPAARSSCSRAG